MKIKGYLRKECYSQLGPSAVTVMVVLPNSPIRLVVGGRDKTGVYVSLDGSCRFPAGIESAIDVVRIEFPPSFKSRSIEAPPDRFCKALLSLYADYPGLVTDSCRALFPVTNSDSVVSARLAEQALRTP